MAINIESGLKIKTFLIYVDMFTKNIKGVIGENIKKINKSRVLKFLSSFKGVVRLTMITFI